MKRISQKQRIIRLFLALIVSVPMVNPTFAQGLPRLPSQPDTRAPIKARGTEGEDMGDLMFSGSPLDAVMEEYRILTDRMPIIAPGVQANVSFRSRQKLSRQERINAIESILAMHSIALVPFRENFVKVVRANEVRKYGMETELDELADKPGETDEVISRVIAFKNMDIKEATAVIEGFKSKNAKVQDLERINGVLITDSAVNISRIMDVLDKIDQPIATQEQLFVHSIRFAKPSEIKGKLEEIIKDLVDDTTKKATVSTTKTSGPPGVIRARPGRTAKKTISSVGAEMEKGIIRGKVKMVADDRTGILVFITMPSNMKLFEDIIKALDIETAPDVMVRVYRLEFAEAATVATMLNNLIGASLGKTDTGVGSATDGEAKGQTLQEFVQTKQSSSEGGKSKAGELSADNIKILSDERTNSLIIMASRGDLVALEEIIEGMDMMLSQVLIEAVIVEVKLSDSLQTGIDWVQRSMLAYKDKAGGGSDPYMAFAAAGGGGTLSPQDATAMSPGGPAGISYYLTHYGLNVDMVMQWAAGDTKSRVLSSPVILTTDNTEAKITSTEQIYVYAGKKYDQNQSVYDDYKEKDVGLELTVTPHINENKIVMMEISQTMSEPGAVGEPQSGARVSSTRTLNASIAVAHRETIILGGQVRNDVTSEKTKIPILGDLPLIGRLFGSGADASSRTELIVFITPYVLDTPNEIAAETLRRKRALDIEDMWQRDWSDSKLAEPTDEQRLLQEREEREREREERKARKKAEKKAKAIAEEEAAIMNAVGDGSGTYEANSERTQDEARELIERNATKWQKSLETIDASTPSGML